MSLDISAASGTDDYERLRLFVEGVRERADLAAAWEPDTVGVPEHHGGDALLRINDVAFYANARTEVATFTEVCLKLLGLHRPRDGGGISSDPAHLPQRCRCCMSQWPCPTIQEMRRLLGG